MSRNILIVEAFVAQPRSLVKYRGNAAKTRSPNGNRTLFMLFRSVEILCSVNNLHGDL